ncbi:unnamed protein product [Scytosiphon promiscuus]
MEGDPQPAGGVPDSVSNNGAPAEEAEGAAGGGDDGDGYVECGDVSYTKGYRPAKVQIGKPHPDPVVENTTLAAVMPPDVTYETHLPPSCLEQLSEVQMESVIYAGQQFARPFLPSLERRGFMIGDGAGVGKGRQLAGIVMDAWMQGHRRHIWFSISPDLLHDTARDLKDIKPGRANRPKVYNLSDCKYEDVLTTNNGEVVGDGVVFSTYKSLTMFNKKGRHTVGRLGQLIRWLGGEKAEGCILFDEAHKAKNLYLKAGPTVTGLRVKEIQDLCPSARVVYCSATPCSEPMNMGYMTRLGLWGEGTQFEDFQDFLKDIDSRGVGAMELVAMQLKAEGMLLSRTLSFEKCEFSLVPLVNNKFQIDTYNVAVHAWQLLWQALLDAAEEDTLYTLKPDKKRKGDDTSSSGLGENLFQKVVVGHDGKLEFQCCDQQEEEDDGEVLDDVGGIEIKKMTLGMMKSMYWAAHQRFFRAMCIAFKVEKAVEITNKALAENMCVVIGLQSTGESNMRDAVRRGDPQVTGHQDFLSAPAEIMKRLIIKLFWVDDEDDISDDDEFSLEPVKKKPKREGKESQSILGWKPPSSPPGAGALSERRTGGGDGTASAPDAEQAERPPPQQEQQQTHPPPQAVEVEDDDEEIIMIDPPENRIVQAAAAEAGGDGGGGGGGGAVAGGAPWGQQPESEPPAVPSPGDDSGGGGGGGGDGVSGGSEAGAEADPAAEERVVRSFTEDEDNTLWGDGETKFEKAQSRLHGWLDRAHLMELPTPPLDDLLDRLGGPDAVAEMTGRTERMVRLDDGSVYLEKRDANNTAGLQGQNNFERAEFNEGRKRIAIISDAASAGVSLHANKKYPQNERRRMHITLELPWSADKAIQQLGRSHRANQFTAPVYQLIVSEVCGESRFSAAVAKRLESLGALTQGDRRASHAGAGELGFTSFNIDNQYGKAALDHIFRLCVDKNEKPVVEPPNLADEESAHIYDEVVETRKENHRKSNRYSSLSRSSARSRRNRKQRIQELEELDVTFTEAMLVWFAQVDMAVEDEEEGHGKLNKSVQGNVSRFLNRILGLRIVCQHILFDYFHAVMEYHVKEAKRNGTYEDGIVSLTGASCRVEVMRTLDLPEKTGLGKGEVEAVKVIIDKSVPFAKIQPIYVNAVSETARRIDLAKRMQAERIAAGNKIKADSFPSKTGFCTRSFNDKRQVYLVIDYPGRVSSGYSGGGRPRNAVTMWSPCRGRAEVPYKNFASIRFDKITEQQASELWDVEMVRDKADDNSFVLRGPRLLMAWPHLDEAYNHLHRPPRTSSGKIKPVRSPVVHVKAVDPVREAAAAAAAAAAKAAAEEAAYLKDFREKYGVLDLDAEEETKEDEVTQQEIVEPFIALQLPRTMKTITEAMANEIFTVLEKGTFSNLRYDP